jgi:putative transposase
MPLLLALWSSLALFCFVRFDRVFRRLLFPARTSVGSGLLQDLPRSKSELVLENALLRHQLAILRRQSKPPHFTSADRFWFLLLASRLKHWKDALVLLQPETLLYWHRAGFRLFWKHKSKPKTIHPKIATEIIALIQQMAQQNPLWGAERLRGELLKLGIKVAKRTIQRYLRRTKPPREPNQTWSTFLHNHANDLWACDFLPVIDLTFRTLFVFFIIELSSRRVVHFAVTRHPTQQWVAQQLREATPDGVHPKFIVRDNDRKFGTAFDRVAQSTGIEVLQIPYRAPRANAVCERFLGSVRRECLDHFLIFGERQLYRVVREYVSYFNHARPHQGLKQQIPEKLESANVEAAAKNRIIPFPGLMGKDSEGRRSTAPEAEANRIEARRKIIAFPVLNGLQHDYRRVA